MNPLLLDNKLVVELILFPPWFVRAHPWWCNSIVINILAMLTTYLTQMLWPQTIDKSTGSVNLTNSWPIPFHLFLTHRVRNISDMVSLQKNHLRMLQVERLALLLHPPSLPSQLCLHLWKPEPPKVAKQGHPDAGSKWSAPRIKNSDNCFAPDKNDHFPAQSIQSVQMH